MRELQWDPGSLELGLRNRGAEGGSFLLCHHWWQRPWLGPGSRGKMEIRWAVPVRWQKDAAHLLGWV